MPTLDNDRRFWECNHCGMPFTLYNLAHRHESQHKGPQYYNWYICCIVNGQLDAVTFPNPTSDFGVVERAFTRANELRAQGKHCYVAEIKEILPKENL